MTKNIKNDSPNGAPDSGYGINFLSELEKTLPPERVKRARLKADKAIFDIKLKNLRKELGITQNKVERFSQSSVSKIENKNDMKISTLINYLDSIGAAIEINVFPKNLEKGKNKLYTILRTIAPQQARQPTHKKELTTKFKGTPKKSGSTLKSSAKTKIDELKNKVKTNEKNDLRSGKQEAKKHS